jgi:hypothetical protein
VDLADFFLVVVEVCFFVVEPAELSEPCPEIGTAATSRQINPARQAVPNLEGKIGEMHTLIYSTL